MHQPIDEYTLAAFLGGTLPAERREEVARYLAQNADARELLHMAFEAMEAAHTSEESADVPMTPRETPVQLPRKPSRRARPAPARRAAAHAPLKLRQLPRYAALAVLVFGVGLGLRLAFGPPTDALRSQQSSERQELTVEVTAPDLAFRWTQVPEADHYRLVVFDIEAAQVVGEHETSALGLDGDAGFTAALRTKLEAGRTYTLRIDAVDAQNRIIKSSKTTEFSIRP